jgi:hypothetical protein
MDDNLPEAISIRRSVWQTIPKKPTATIMGNEHNSSGNTDMISDPYKPGFRTKFTRCRTRNGTVLTDSGTLIT